MAEMLSVGAVSALGAALWWLLRARFERDQRDHDELRTALSKLTDGVANVSGSSVSVESCRLCHAETINRMQALDVRMSSLQSDIADVREGVASMAGKLDALARLVSASRGQ